MPSGSFTYCIVTVLSPALLPPSAGFGRFSLSLIPGIIIISLPCTATSTSTSLLQPSPERTSPCFPSSSSLSFYFLLLLLFTTTTLYYYYSLLLLLVLSFYPDRVIPPLFPNPSGPKRDYIRGWTPLCVSAQNRQSTKYTLVSLHAWVFRISESSFPSLLSFVS